MSRRSRRTAPTSAERLPSLAVRGLALGVLVGACSLLPVSTATARPADRPAPSAAASASLTVKPASAITGEKVRLARHRAVEEGPARGAAAQEGQRLAEGDRGGDLDEGRLQVHPRRPRQVDQVPGPGEERHDRREDPASRDNPDPRAQGPAPDSDPRPPRRGVGGLGGLRHGDARAGACRSNRHAGATGGHRLDCGGDRPRGRRRDCRVRTGHLRARPAELPGCRRGCQGRTLGRVGGPHRGPEGRPDHRHLAAWRRVVPRGRRQHDQQHHPHLGEPVGRRLPRRDGPPGTGQHAAQQPHQRRPGGRRARSGGPGHRQWPGRGDHLFLRRVRP